MRISPKRSFFEDAPLFAYHLGAGKPINAHRTLMLIFPIRQVFFEGDNQFAVEVPAVAFARFFEFVDNIVRDADSRFDQCLVFVLFVIHRCICPYYIGEAVPAQEGDAKQRPGDSL
jgi:hypothetical protein